MAKLEHCPWLIPAIVLSVMLVGHPDPAVGQDGGAPVVEPGFPAEDGTWILPFTRVDDQTFSLSDADYPVVYHDGRSLVLRELPTFSFRGGGRTTAMVVLLDSPHLEPSVIETWAVALGRLLDQEVTPGVLASVATCGPEVPAIVIPGKASDSPGSLLELLSVQPPSRLWDGILEAITILAEPGLPGRRVLVLVSDGREEVLSRHVLNSCIDAALRARVAVHVLFMASGMEAAAEKARLHELARRTGGQMVEGPGPAGSQLFELLARVGSAQALRIEAGDYELPVEIDIRWGGGSGLRSTGEIARRQVLRPPGFDRWLIIGSALFVAGGAGYLLWRQRAIVVGDLLIQTKSGVRRFPIPVHGVTIGLGNRLVSRHHAVVRVKDGDVIISDLRSSRGTMVNGEPIGTRKLDSGDRILVGGAVELVFKAIPTSG